MLNYTANIIIENVVKFYDKNSVLIDTRGNFQG